ncbi:hypothetical protein HDF08_000310 [Edaphobacter lichenicola]|uniref:Uncharacterized protein n=1 Tax=Tunturiibacter lichenicola TaxID=2051959 RepID=A0A852V5N3_9BACT|nr:hypothetical protein [Edaphobacter lichenicola]
MFMAMSSRHCSLLNNDALGFSSEGIFFELDLSIAEGVKLIRHAFVLVWRGNLLFWGLTGFRGSMATVTADPLRDDKKDTAKTEGRQRPKRQTPA